MIGTYDHPAEIHPASAPDYVPVPQMRELQLGRLRATVRRAYQHVELYRQRMDERNVSPEDMRTLDDLARFPFTVKADLRDSYPFGLFASPLEEVVRLHASSGTTGKPIVVAYTEQDLAVWTNAMVRTVAACGLGRGDIIQNAYGYGLFTGGLGAHYGAEALGATVIPISGGNTDRQIMVMKDFNVTAICCTPTYFLHLLDRAAEMGAERYLLWLEDSLSNAVRVSERQTVAVDSFTRVLDQLYSKHVETVNVAPYVTHVPLFSLRAAAGQLGEDMPSAEEDWVRAPEGMRLGADMFVAHVVGRSMEPRIPDGSLNLFRFRPVGSRQGKILLIQRLGTLDETARYTVKRYTSKKVETGEEEIKALGFRQYRVRFHGEVVRIEIAREEMARAMSVEMAERFTAIFKRLGLKYVTLDLEGYRQG